jgi:hypothetical protein
LVFFVPWEEADVCTEQTDDVKRRFDYEPLFKEFVRRAFEEGVLEGVLEGLKR